MELIYHVGFDAISWNCNNLHRQQCSLLRVRLAQSPCEVVARYCVVQFDYQRRPIDLDAYH
jgi:hypothetical protein